MTGGKFSIKRDGIKEHIHIRTRNGGKEVMSIMSVQETIEYKPLQ